MADKEIGGLTAAGTLTGAELVHVVQSSNSRQTTTQDIADLGGFGAAAIYTRVSRASAVSLTSGTNTLISFDTEEADTDAFWAASPNPSRIVFPFTGKYRWNIEYVVAAATVIRGMQCVLNKNRAGSTTFQNTDFPGTFSEGFFAAAGSAIQHSVYNSGILEAASADYAELVVWQSGGTIDTRNVRVTMQYIGT